MSTMFLRSVLEGHQAIRIRTPEEVLDYED